MVEVKHGDQRDEPCLLLTWPSVTRATRSARGPDPRAPFPALPSVPGAIWARNPRAAKTRSGSFMAESVALGAGGSVTVPGPSAMCLELRPL